MSADNLRRRVLLAASPSSTKPMQQLFSQTPLDVWEPIQAESFLQARFILQHHACEVALVHEDLYLREGGQSLAWFGREPPVPIVFLTSYRAETMTQAYAQGVTLCLPRDLSFAQPELLATALDRAVQLGEVSRGKERVQEQLTMSRRHIDRLVNLLWRTLPMEPNTSWFSHRHTLERLQEEISRTARHGGPMTLALAEVQEEKVPEVPEVLPLEEWTANLVGKGKRRCDVAGSYGMQGFLLLMVHTPKNGGIVCCRRLQQLLEQGAASPEKGGRGRIRAYFGLASAAAANASAPSLLRLAEENLEAAKGGKDQGVVAG
jgi:PleD family two-component response regulator